MDECIAPVLDVRRGRWRPDRAPEADGLGLLVLDGVVLRSLGVEGRFGAELLGEGDLLRPWQRETISPRLRQAVMWRALYPTRLAVLDGDVAKRLARYPELIAALIDQTLDRARRLAINVAIVHQPRGRGSAAPAAVASRHSVGSARSEGDRRFAVDQPYRSRAPRRGSAPHGYDCPLRPRPPGTGPSSRPRMVALR